MKIRRKNTFFAGFTRWWGNRTHINPNGKTVIDLMTLMNMKLAHKYERADGTFTRFPDKKYQDCVDINSIFGIWI